MTLAEKRQRFTLLMTDLLLYCRQEGLHVAVDMCKRSLEEQRRLVKLGASQTLQSKHIQGLAVDLLLYDAQGRYVSDAKPYEPLGTYWRTLDPDNVWGGTWRTLKDAGHFEFTG